MNTILIKHGTDAPNVNNLETYELGYCTSDKNLYIKDEAGIVRLTSSGTVILKGNLNIISENEIFLGVFNEFGLNITENCAIFVDFDYSANGATDALIKKFRKADFVYFDYTATTLRLKPINQSAVGSTDVFPIQVTVVY